MFDNSDSSSYAVRHVLSYRRMRCTRSTLPDRPLQGVSLRADEWGLLETGVERGMPSHGSTRGLVLWIVEMGLERRRAVVYKVW
jgi:hypothetical protein